MKFGFICPQVPGHLNPMTALARHLQMRGHEVVFLYSSGAAGLPFIPDEEVERVISERSAEISKKQGEETLKLTTSLLMSQSESMIKSLPAIVQSNQTFHTYTCMPGCILTSPGIRPLCFTDGLMRPTPPP